MWLVAIAELFSVSSGCELLSGATQRPLPDYVTIVGRGSDEYMVRGCTIVITIIFVPR